MMMKRKIVLYISQFEFDLLNILRKSSNGLSRTGIYKATGHQIAGSKHAQLVDMIDARLVRKLENEIYEITQYGIDYIEIWNETKVKLDQLKLFRG